MNIYLKIARDAINEFVINNKIISLDKDLPKSVLLYRSGVFVSVYENGDKDRLRGCIGTYLPTKENIAEEIIYNAIAACSKDYRFNPISIKELNKIKISIDIIHEMHLVNNIDTLDPKKFGILIEAKNNSSSALLLPNIQQITTIHDQIAATLKKAGLTTNDDINIYKFEITHYQE